VSMEPARPDDAAEGGGPVVLIGYAGVLPYLAKFLPDRSVIFIEEPDVVRKRDVHAATAESATLREVIEWEYQLDGAADSFYNRHRDLRPGAVVPISEYGVPFAARLAERYGVPGATYGAALALRNKQLLRRVTSAAGIPNPRSVEVDGPAEVRAFMSEVGGPIVLKPANRQASIGTKIVYDPAEVDASWIECMDQDEGVMIPDRGIPMRMLAERFVDGDEYSVEMMFDHGRPAFGAVTKKFLYDGPRPVEKAHLHPADIGPELSQRLVGDTSRVLAAVGMDTGFVHCEWIVEDGVPHLVECAGRMAGDGIIELVLIAWDYEIVSEFYGLMQGRPLTAEVPASPPRYAAAWLGRAPAGEVESVDGVEEARALPGVHTCVASVAPGEEIHELRSSWDRASFVTAEGATPEEAMANAQLAADRIAIKVRQRVTV
jgi:biotin carboxylase